MTMEIEEVPEKRHSPMDEEMQDALLQVISLRPDYLTDFEKGILNDRLKAIQEYGDNAVCTAKQKNILWGIIRKVRRTEKARTLEPL